MAAAPRAMKMPRRTSARMMPTSSTVCWSFRGTANLLMMMTKTNRLSTHRLVLGEPAGEELTGVLATGDCHHTTEAEQDGAADEEREWRPGFAHRRVMRPPAMTKTSTARSTVIRPIVRNQTQVGTFMGTTFRSHIKWPEVSPAHRWWTDGSRDRR